MEFFELSNDFAMMFVRLLINIVFTWLIIDRLYFKKSQRRDFYFTFMLIAMAIFFIVFFMIVVLEDMKGKTSMGVGIGLFGIFSIMRYRTDTMPVREMTYLFIIVCLSVVHAMINIEQELPNHFADLARLVIIDIIVIVSILFCELKLRTKPTKLVQYDRIELIKPEKYEELKADLEQRLGIKVIKVDVGGVDFLKDTAVLKVTYDSQGTNDVDGIFKVRKSQWREV